MYRSPLQLWEGFSKNIYEGVGERWWGLAMVIFLYSLAFISPYILLLLALTTSAGDAAPALLPLSVTALAANFALRASLALRHNHSWLGALLHPFGVIGLLTIAVNSMRWSLKGTVRWRGRVYNSRAHRESAPGQNELYSENLTQPSYSGGNP